MFFVCSTEGHHFLLCVCIWSAVSTETKLRPVSGLPRSQANYRKNKKLYEEKCCLAYAVANCLASHQSVNVKMQSVGND